MYTFKIQQFSNFVRNIIITNIGLFIYVGIISVCFSPKFIYPIITYLLPLMIGYTGGNIIGGKRGGILGAITTMGVIAGANIPIRIMVAIIPGALGGLVIKRFDRFIEGKVKSCFDMLVKNFAIGIFGTILSVLAFLVISPIIEWLYNSHILPFIKFLWFFMLVWG